MLSGLAEFNRDLGTKLCSSTTRLIHRTAAIFALLVNMLEAEQNTVVIAVDGSEHCKKAFDCELKKLFLLVFYKFTANFNFCGQRLKMAKGACFSWSRDTGPAPF